MTPLDEFPWGLVPFIDKLLVLFPQELTFIAVPKRGTESDLMSMEYLALPRSC